MIFIAVTELAEVPTPGKYSVNVTIPSLGLSASLQVQVNAYDAGELNAWMEQTIEKIVSNSDSPARFELAKALTGVSGDIAELYACRLLNEAKLLAIPVAVDKLEAIGNVDATRCLINALPDYDHTQHIYGEYIKASLVRIRKATSNSQIRQEIDTMIGAPPK